MENRVLKNNLIVYEIKEFYFYKYMKILFCVYIYFFKQYFYVYLDIEDKVISYKSCLIFRIQIGQIKYFLCR